VEKKRMQEDVDTRYEMIFMPFAYTEILFHIRLEEKVKLV